VLEESPVFPVPSIKSNAAIDVSRQADERPHVAVFDLFKVCVGPSSSHASWPSIAAANFMSPPSAASIERIRLALLGSLSRTDEVHATQTTVVARSTMGMMPAESIRTGRTYFGVPCNASDVCAGLAAAPCFFGPEVDLEELKDDAR
jgi:Serine dehydratase beta chain